MEEHDESERIGAEGTEPVGAAPRSGEACQRALDEALDAALACTFPASDPIGCLEPHMNCAVEKGHGLGAARGR